MREAARKPVHLIDHLRAVTAVGVPAAETSEITPRRRWSQVDAFRRLGARLVGATFLLDRAYLTLDRGRSILVTAFASDGVLAAYNDLTYEAAPVYDPETNTFREELFTWEKELIAAVFPKPPSRVLVGGAGGGREALQLAALGYDVTAFEPSERLAHSMRARALRDGAAIDVLRGRYEDLPLLRRIETGETCDLSAGPRFAAAILGWTSFSHLRTSALRSRTLRAFAEITDGPVVASFFLRPSARAPRGAFRRYLDTLGRRTEGDRFTTHIGYYHLSSREELASEVRAAGLETLAESYEDETGWPWIAVARPEIAARCDRAKALDYACRSAAL